MVTVALDSFKGSIGSAAAGRAIRRGWQSQRPSDIVNVLPIADGGEGTIDAVSAAVTGAKVHELEVDGPVAERVVGRWLECPDGTAVVELASASGLMLASKLDPVGAHTAGFGQLIADALDHGARRILLALGGSATTDGGVGALLALGAELRTSGGSLIPLGNSGLAELATIDLTSGRPLPPDGVTVLVDVDNPLTGERGAAAVFGPQKGADTEQIRSMDANLESFAELVASTISGGPDPDSPGSGSAGGTAFGMALWGAQLRRGGEEIAAITGLADQISASDVVITGEGCFDGQTAGGKAPAVVAGMSAGAGVPCLLVAGSIIASTDEFAAAESLSLLAGDVDQAIADPGTYLVLAGKRLAAKYQEQVAGAHGVRATAS